MALAIRLPGWVREPIVRAAVGACVVGATAAFAWPGAVAAPADLMTAATAPQPLLAGFSATRLTSELGAEYGFRFMSPTAPTDRGSVDMATARDSAGDQLRVIVFGRAPEPVHGLACEFTPAHANAGAGARATTAAAGFLSDCARLGSGQAQASAVASWVARTQARLAAQPSPQPAQLGQPTPFSRLAPGGLTAQTSFAANGYVVRRLPQTGEWIVAVTGEAR